MEQTSIPNLTYVIGDIHGCYHELLLLEEKLTKHASQHDRKPLFVSVGDLIDRGAFSKEVVQHFRKGNEKGSHFVVAGNHEASFLDVLCFFSPLVRAKIAALNSNLKDAGKISHPYFCTGIESRYERSLEKLVMDLPTYGTASLELWLRQGGEETLESFQLDRAHPEKWDVDEEELFFLAQLPLIWENEIAIVTHAAASSESISYFLEQSGGSSPLWNKFAHAQHVENLLWSRERRVEPARESKTHISGHTPRKRAAKGARSRRVYVDTGCVFGNKLTAYCVEFDEFLSIESTSGEDEGLVNCS